MAKIVYRQMPTPRELPQQMPAPRAKARRQKPQGGGKFLVQIPGGAQGGMVMDEIDTCIITTVFVQMIVHMINKRPCRPYSHWKLNPAHTWFFGQCSTKSAFHLHPVTHWS